MAQKINRPKETPVFVKTYLIAYNAFSALSWGYVLIFVVIHLFNLDGKSDLYSLATKHSPTATLSRWLSQIPLLNYSLTIPLETQLPASLQPLYRYAQTTYLRIGTPTAFIQSFAVLEVFHVLFGWVRSPLPTTAAQVASRLFLVWGITEQFPVTQSLPLYTTMVLAWSTVEVIRYSFYTFSLIGLNPRILLWLRYTAFYILYPLGASSEASLIYASLPSSSIFSGTWNPTDYVRAALFVIWWPALYALCSYMIAQRRRVLGSQGRKLKSN